MTARVLFVCTGNTCRSPFAEVLARRLVEERGLSIDVSRAGTGAPNGAPASDGSMLVGVERNLDLSPHRSRTLTEQIVREASLVLAMSPHHVQRAVQLGGAGKSYLLAEYATGTADGRGISDPFGAGLDAYRRMADDMEALIPLVIERVAREFSDAPRRLVLVGHPVAKSLSPTFQNAAIAAAGLRARYEAVDLAANELPEAFAAFCADDVAGNVTAPHKEAVFALCDRRSPIADRVGAVNTFWIEDGSLIGDNTDVGGFDEAVRAAFGQNASFPRVALLGAGGAAAAVLAAAERWTAATVAIASRTPERAAKLAARFPLARAVASVEEALDGASLVVNASPLGMSADDAFPCAIGALPRHAHVYELVYTRGESAWVRAARAAGYPAADGLGMLIAQGALAFERWFGVIPDREAMWASVRA